MKQSLFHSKHAVSSLAGVEGEASLDNSQKISTARAKRNENVTSSNENECTLAAEIEGSLRSGRVDAWEMAWQQESWGVEGATCGADTAEKLEGDEVKVVPMLCGKWSCPVCGRLKYRWFVRNVRQAVEAHKLKYFWTLTIAHGDCTPIESWALISAAWNRFRLSMEREGYPLTFIWVVEPHKTGHAHMHVLWDKRVHKKIVERLWRRATGGSYIVEFEVVRDDKVAHYLAKYCQKLAGRIIEVPGMGELVNKHRFAKSRCIKFSAFRQKSDGWVRYAQSYKDALAFFVKQDRVVRVASAGVPSFSYGAEYLGPWQCELGRRPAELLEGQIADPVRRGALYEVAPAGSTISPRTLAMVQRVNDQRMGEAHRLARSDNPMRVPQDDSPQGGR